jgi:hypothetical protein
MLLKLAIRVPLLVTLATVAATAGAVAQHGKVW